MDLDCHGNTDNHNRDGDVASINDLLLDSRIQTNLMVNLLTIPLLSKDELEQLYWEEGLSQKKIAD